MRLDRLPPGTRFRSGHRTGVVVYVSRGMRVRVRWDGKKLDNVAVSADVVPLLRQEEWIMGDMVNGEKALEPVVLPGPPSAALPGAMRRLLGLLPQTYAELEGLSARIAPSTLCPKDYKGRAGDILLCMLHGAEVGLFPLQALQSIAVINGRPSVWGDGALAIVQSSGLLADKDEHIKQEGATADDITAYCTLTRRGYATPITGKFSVADAKKAKLWGKQGPWTDYPRRMLQMRARSWALRDGFADVLHGLSIVEEAMDITPLPGEQPGASAPKARKATTRSVEATLAADAGMAEAIEPAGDAAPADIAGAQESLL